jgi:hypothetical protein
MDIHSTSNANVCTTYTNYDFSKVSLMHPESLHGSSGTFFTKIGIGNVNEVLYIQTPKCITKQGVTTTAGKKAYIDLMFSNEDTSFIEFMENLEKSCIEKIHEKKNSWFTNEIDQADIENAFTSALRPFKGGKYYSMRANIAPSKNLMKVPTCFIFDETEKQLTIEDVKPENDIISVLEIQGIKFSQRSFQFEIIIRQVLIMANKPVFQSCLIKKHVGVGVGVGVESISAPSTHSTMSLDMQVSEQEDSKNKDNKDNINSKDVEDSLAVLHNSNHESVNTRDTTLFESHATDKKVLLSPNLAPNLAPKPVSNVLSSLASSMLGKDETEETGDTEETGETEENGESIDKQNTKLQPQKQKTEHKDSQEITEITEVDLEIKDDEKIKIKKPNDIYYEIYKEAKEKARATRKLAFDAYLEVKKIKNTYMLDDSDSDTDYNSDSDSSSGSGSGYGYGYGSGSGSDTENE